MMEPVNNEQIISRLLGEQQHHVSATPAEDEEVMITTSRVVGIRYRIYFLITLLLGFLLVQYPLRSAWILFQSTKDQASAIALEVSNFAVKKLQMDADKVLIDKMNSQEQIIVSCLNERVACQDIDDAIKNNFWFARAYIQLNNLTDTKMVINEKILLSNINEYLLKDDRWSKNGLVSKIAIGESQQYEGNLWFVPVNLAIGFANKDSLLSFLNNVEKRILSDPQFRILYKINQVSYDITEYTSQQNVDVELSAYYYTN